MIETQDSHTTNQTTSPMGFIFGLIMTVSAIAGWYLYSQTSAQVEALKQDNSNLKLTADNKTNRVYKLLDSQQSIKDKFQTEIDGLNAQLLSSHQEVKTLQNEQAKTQNRLKSIPLIKQSLETCNKNSSTKINTLNSDLKALMAQSDKQKIISDELELKVQECHAKKINTDEIDLLKKQLSEYELKVIEHEFIKQQINDEMVSYKTTAEQAENKVEQLKSKLDVTNDKLSISNSDVIKANKLIKKTLQQIKGLQLEISTLEQEKQTLIDENKTLINKNKTLKSADKNRPIQKSVLVTKPKTIKLTETKPTHVVTLQSKPIKTVPVQTTQVQMTPLHIKMAKSPITNDSLKQLESKLNHEIKKQQLSVSVSSDQSTLINMASDIMFLTGSYQISSHGIKILSQVADYLNTFPERKVHVIGHTDNHPLRKPKDKSNYVISNWELSAARAAAAIRYLQFGKKVAPNRMTLLGASQYQPINTKNTADARQKNRRLEIKLLTK